MAIISSFDVVIVVLISIISYRLQNCCAVKSSLWLRTGIVTACGYEDCVSDNHGQLVAGGRGGRSSEGDETFTIKTPV